MTTKKVALELEKEIEDTKVEMRRSEAEDPGRKEKTQAENTEASWQEYFEWRGYIWARKEELQKSEKKMEGLKKFVEEETRKEAEAAKVVDEEEETEKYHKDLERLKVLMEKWDGTHIIWEVGRGMKRGVKLY